MRRTFKVRQNMREKVVWIRPPGVAILGLELVGFLMRMLILLRASPILGLVLVIVEYHNLINAKHGRGARNLAG